jgi:hypothetical protein
VLDQQQQDIKRDSLKLQSTAGAAQFIGIAVEYNTVSEFDHVHGHVATT